MRLLGLDISSPVMNAAGPFAKSLDDVRQFARTKAGMIVVGSVTREARAGNAEPRYFASDAFSLNAYGLPNPGLDHYIASLPAMAEVAHQAGKPLVLSVAGFSLDDYLTIIEATVNRGPDVFELNLSCPNTDQAVQCFDLSFMRSLSDALPGVTLPIMVKLSPYANTRDIQAVAALVNARPHIAGVVCSNSFPGGYFARDGQPVLAQRFGGVGGATMLPISLGQVRQFRALLDPDKTVFGVGGVESARRIDDYLAAGAQMVQAASHIMRHGHTAIDKLASWL